MGLSLEVKLGGILLMGLIEGRGKSEVWKLLSEILIILPNQSNNGRGN